jgi:hypothetical protein
MVADEVSHGRKTPGDPPAADCKERNSSSAGAAKNGDAAGRRKSGARKGANGSSVLAAFPERDQSASDEAALESLKGRWFNELLTRELERRGVAELLKALGVNLAEVWRRDLCAPFTYEYFDLHGKGDLMRLAEELGVPIEAGNSKMILIRQLMAHPKTKQRLPAELAI